MIFMHKGHHSGDPEPHCNPEETGAIDTPYVNHKVTWEWGHVNGWNLSTGKLLQ